MGGGPINLAVLDDRLEVTSTGPLHSGADPGRSERPAGVEALEPADRPHLLPARHDQEWGRGTIKMAALATVAGLLRPEIEEHGDCVTVRFRRVDYLPSGHCGNDLIERQEAITVLLGRSGEGLPLREILARLPLHTSDRQVRRALGELDPAQPAGAYGVVLGSYWGLIPIRTILRRAGNSRRVCGKHAMMRGRFTQELSKRQVHGLSRVRELALPLGLHSHCNQALAQSLAAWTKEAGTQPSFAL